MHRAPSPSLIASLTLALPLALACDAGAKDRSAAVVCKGGSMTLKNRTIKAPKDGLTVKRGCSVTLVDSRIEAGRHAINLRHGSTITIRGSTIKGKKSAIRLGGSGDARVKGSTLIGRIYKKGSGKLIDEGGNTFGKPSAEAAPTPKGGRKRHPPVACKGDQKLTLKRKRIEGAKTAILIKGRCEVTLVDCHVQGSSFGVHVTARGKLTLIKGQVAGGEAALRLENRAVAVNQGAKLVGKVRKSGKASYTSK